MCSSFPFSREAIRSDDSVLDECCTVSRELPSRCDRLTITTVYLISRMNCEKVLDLNI